MIRQTELSKAERRHRAALRAVVVSGRALSARAEAYDAAAAVAVLKNDHAYADYATERARYLREEERRGR